MYFLGWFLRSGLRCTAQREKDRESTKQVHTFLCPVFEVVCQSLCLLFECHVFTCVCASVCFSQNAASQIKRMRATTRGRKTERERERERNWVSDLNTKYDVNGKLYTPLRSLALSVHLLLQFPFICIFFNVSFSSSLNTTHSLI